ncbi:hypothetical protein AG1IA_04044 [Rhizoctonia solani AG-1 IA]|uniref:Uncharacterized protein n=1 Tax=Thanatephorus cucumeris (strain AG1-IA) TaxID=983506 RepID=L8WZX5_THACA|nr:hypothetical protein AG1IA_04044 [Rhizoctonia solani AG-1 IA]
MKLQLLSGQYGNDNNSSIFPGIQIGKITMRNDISNVTNPEQSPEEMRTVIRSELHHESRRSQVTTPSSSSETVSPLEGLDSPPPPPSRGHEVAESGHSRV